MAADLNNRAVIFETDASNNTATDPGWPENMAPSRVNDAARALQGAIARDWDRRGPTVTSGGSANAQTLTYTVAQTAIVRGDSYAFVAGFTNTGATTLAVSGLTAKAVRLANAALTGGEIVSGQTYVVMYDGTAYQLVSPISTGRGGLVGVQVFTTTGGSTYTPTAGATTYLAWVVGGGGGGGGAAATGAGQASVGGPGAGGGFAQKKGLVSAISGATVTAGAKGTGGTAGNNNGVAGSTSSIGAVVTATGGAGGQGGGAVTPPTSSTSNGAPGTGASGDINVLGRQGGISFAIASTFAISGQGGGGFWGGEGGPQGTATSVAGNPGNNYGAGGTGGACAASQTAKAGGDGSQGVVIIWEYN